MSLLTRTVPRRRSRWRVTGIVLATLSVAAALLSAATISAGSAAAASCGTTNLALHQPTTAAGRRRLSGATRARSRRPLTCLRSAS